MTAFPSSFTALERDATLLEHAEWVAGKRVLEESFRRFQLLCVPLMRPRDPPLPHMNAPWSGRRLVRRWREMRHREWAGEPQEMPLPSVSDEDRARYHLWEAWRRYRCDAPRFRRIDDEVLKSLGVDAEYVGCFPTDQSLPPEGFTIEWERQHHAIVEQVERHILMAELAQMEAARQRLAPSISDNGEGG